MRIIGECPCCHHQSQIHETDDDGIVMCLACREVYPEANVIDDDDEHAGLPAEGEL